MPIFASFRHRLTPPRPIRWRYVSTELGIIIAAILFYFLVRGLTEGSTEQAFNNADRVMRLQDRMGIGWEATVQEWIVDQHAIVTFFNWIYMWGHWPVIAGVAIWLVIVRPADYRFARNAFLISGGIGLIIFATFPVAPPRFADPEIIDTVTEHSNSYRVLQPPALVNKYAAVPSLHFGWNLIIGITLVWKAQHIAGRTFGVVLPPLMLLAIVLTGNHYVFDAIAGGIVALAGVLIALWIREWRETGEPAPA